MVKSKFLVSLIVIFSLSLGFNPAFAQSSKGLTSSEKAELTGTRRQLATIVFAGLAGAILGLSTLSFYGRPQEHLSNIAIGGALGVITGASFTTYKAATSPYDAYDLGYKLRDSREDILASLNGTKLKIINYQWNF